MNNFKKYLKARSSKGFTIFEIVIVIIVLSILYTLASFHISGLQAEAKIARAKGDLKTIELAINSYLKNKSACPPQEDYQTALLFCNPKILDKNLMDPFGATVNTLYSYIASSNQKYYAVYSLGSRGNGSVTVDNGGTVLVEGSAIYETNGYVTSNP
jgi:general secretion pathway protein G